VLYRLGRRLGEGWERPAEVLMDPRKREDLQVHEHLGPRYAAQSRATSVYVDLWYQVLTKDVDLAAAEAVLDFCCGDGRLLTRLPPLGGALRAGVDLSDVMLGLAQGAARSAHLVRGDGEELPFREESFDFVFSLGALHHLPTPSAGAREIARVLRSGGQLLLSEPCADSLILRVPRKLLRHLKGFGQAHKAVASEELQSVLAEHGLQVERRTYFGHVGFLFCVLDHQLGLVRGLPRRLQEPVARALTWLDRALMRVPGVSPQAFHIVMYARKGPPRPAPRLIATSSIVRRHRSRTTCSTLCSTRKKWGAHRMSEPRETSGTGQLTHQPDSRPPEMEKGEPIWTSF